MQKQQNNLLMLLDIDIISKLEYNLFYLTIVYVEVYNE